MKKLLFYLLALCLLLALSACGEADQRTDTHPEAMTDIPFYTEPEDIDFDEKDFFGDLDFEDYPADKDPLEEI